MADRGRGRVTPGTLRLFRVAGIPVEVRPSWFLVTGVIAWVVAPVVRSADPALGSTGVVLTALLFALLIYASILLHEIAHTLVALRFGLPVRAITLQFLGGASEIEREPETPWREFAVAVVGPLVSLALGGLALAVDSSLGTGLVKLVLFQLALSNLLVGGFNLLPGLPLDGGRVLRALVWKITGDATVATAFCAAAGKVVAVLMVVVPWLLQRRGVLPVSTLTLLWLVALAVFMWTASSQAAALARLKTRLPSVAARALARRAVPVTAGMPVSQAVRAAQEMKGGALVVVDHDGRPVGLVSENAVEATPENRRPWIDISDLSQRLEPGLLVSTGLAGEDLLAVLRNRPSTEYLVVEPDGRTFGVLARRDVDAAFARAVRPAR